MELLKVEKNISVQNIQKPPIGSLGQRNFLDLSDRIDPEAIIVESLTSHSGETVAKYFQHGESKVGYDEEAFKPFKKFIKNIYKNKEISSWVSAGCIEELAFKWIIQVYQNQMVAKLNLSSYLTTNINERVLTQKYHFPILNLDISSTFNLGAVSISYFSKEDFKSALPKVLYNKNSGIVSE